MFAMTVFLVFGEEYTLCVVAFVPLFIAEQEALPQNTLTDVLVLTDAFYAHRQQRKKDQRESVNNDDDDESELH